MANRTYRAWINQPSTLDLFQSYHGQKCIVQDDGELSVRVWFTEGPIHSMVIPRNCVSELKISKAG